MGICPRRGMEERRFVLGGEMGGCILCQKGVGEFGLIGGIGDGFILAGGFGGEDLC